MTSSIVFDPLLPFWALYALGALVVVFALVALWRGLSGWALRGLAGLALVAALAQPSWRQEERAPLSDIVIMVEDESASQRLSDRADQTAEAATRLAAAIAARPNTELRRVTVGDGEGDTGTAAMAALAEALSEEPIARVSGVIVLSDGRVHDIEAAPQLPAPLHLLLSGRTGDWDRRLVVRNAPAFAILGEEVTLTLRIEDQGDVPAAAGRIAPLDISVDGAAPQRFSMPVGEDVELPVTLPHGGRNVIQFTVPEAEGELTTRNNTALVQMNGVRDRLRVLLVSGAPHPGGRTWRNLLKSDSSVDLVHFTILRPPEKQDGVPVEELSLIAFPTRELFLDKIDDFDLIIFDRYRRRGILPAIYLDNVARYIEEGGAVLINAGPDFASADSIYRSPLGDVLPGRPTARVIEEAYRPTLTEIGRRHPVTAGLETAAPWGRWLRQVELEPQNGDVVMTGAGDAPLLILDRVEQGRVALLASDQAWLWDRGYDGGGPQLELLRRLAHWSMKEPDLEEEMLWAEPTGQTMRIIRRSLGEQVPDVEVTTPSGETVELTLEETAPGRFETTYEGPEIGLYRLVNGAETAVIGLGPAAPREFEETIATGEVMAPLTEALRGGTWRLEDGLPSLRNVSAGRPAAGRGWIGLTPRNAFEKLDVRQMPLLPPWLTLLIAASLITGAWLWEGRRQG